jgi:hypothetical protein
MKVPCKDCMLVPICQNKFFYVLITECIILYKYLYAPVDSPDGFNGLVSYLHDKSLGPYRRRNDMKARVINVELELKPSRWKNNILTVHEPRDYYRGKDAK